MHHIQIRRSYENASLDTDVSKQGTVAWIVAIDFFLRIQLLLLLP